MDTNKGIIVKVLLILVLQILISIPLYIVGFLILGPLAYVWIVEQIAVAVLFLIALHLTLLILSKKFVQNDAKYLSTWLAIVYIGFYIASSIYYLDLSSLLTGIIYAMISFFYIKWFIEKKFKKQTPLSK